MSRSSSSKLSLEWTRHLPEAKRGKFEETVRNDTLVLSRLKDIVDEKLRAIETKEGSPEFYDSGYPFSQAHVNGKREAFKEISRLLEFLNG